MILELDGNIVHLELVDKLGLNMSRNKEVSTLKRSDMHTASPPT
jgi:hypothetical protein